MKSFCIKLSRSDNSCCAKIKPEKFYSLIQVTRRLAFSEFQKTASSDIYYLHGFSYASFLHYALSLRWKIFLFPFHCLCKKGNAKEEDSWVHQGIFMLSMDSRDCHINHLIMKTSDDDRSVRSERTEPCIGSYVSDTKFCTENFSCIWCGLFGTNHSQSQEEAQSVQFQAIQLWTCDKLELQYANVKVPQFCSAVPHQNQERYLSYASWQWVDYSSVSLWTSAGARNIHENTSLEYRLTQTRNGSSLEKSFASKHGADLLNCTFRQQWQAAVSPIQFLAWTTDVQLVHERHSLRHCKFISTQDHGNNLMFHNYKHMKTRVS